MRPTEKPVRPRRTALWLLFLLPWLLLLSMALMALMVLQSAPAVAPQPAPATAELDQALALLKAHDPRKAEAGRVQALSLSARELEIIINHGGQRWFRGVAGRVQLVSGKATLRLSLDISPWLPRWLAWLPLGRWVNAEVQVLQTPRWPALGSVAVGHVPLPSRWVMPLAVQAMSAAGLADEMPLLAELVQRVRFSPQHMDLVYAWQAGLAERMIKALVPADDRLRYGAYAERLSALLHSISPQRQVSLAELMGPMMALAQQRSSLRASDAALENRAVIVVLALYLNGRRLQTLLPEGVAPVLPPMQVLLRGRDDWPLHFIISAALATESTGPLAHAIGLFKEVLDARGGSGFSFNDIAADLAGQRFGEAAVKDPRALLAALSRAALSRQQPGGALRDEDLMPHAHDLPEFMPQAEFLSRYGGIGAPAFQAQMAEIERRVAALAFLRKDS